MQDRIFDSMAPMPDHCYGQTTADVAIDKANEADGSVPVYVENGPASSTITVSVTRYAKDEGV